MDERLELAAREAADKWQAAQAATAQARNGLKAALAEVETTSPANAIAAGKNLADAAADHHGATSRVAFYEAAVTAAEAAETQARQAAFAAGVERDARPGWNAAVDRRIAAAAAAETATKALAAAVADYSSATDAITGAYNRGLPRPSNHESMWLPLGAMKTEAEERAFWGRHK